MKPKRDAFLELVPKEQISVHALDLIDAYEVNEFAADAKYKGKTVLVRDDSPSRDRAVETAKNYPARLSEMRKLIIKDLAPLFVICIAAFGLGHGLFYLVYWIKIGFSDME